MSFEWSVQQAVFQKISAQADIVAGSIPVYDDVPQVNDAGDPVNFPYVVVGDDSLINWDTDTELGCEIEITIHTWSRYDGKKQLKLLQGYVYDALHRADFTISGYHVTLCVFTDSDSFVDADGKSRHGIQKFNLLIEKV